MKFNLNIIILFLILIVVGMLYKKFEDKLKREENEDNYISIQQFLLDDKKIHKSKKPILWIHVPYEYNSRKWESFGSRSSLDLNQPYLYLTVKSILNQCEDSFTICLIDDNSFEKLIPNWSVDMSRISTPILDNVRKMGLMKLLYIYGGMICPLSFLCMRDLMGMYKKGTDDGRFFLCQTNNHNITSTTYNFYPSIQFSGANKENQTVGELIDFMQRIISHDFTAQSVFLGDFDRWCEKRIQSGKIRMIDGVEIGVKTVEDDPILLEDLMSQQYLKIYPGAYGIFIPSDEILKRRNYEWFSRLSHKQVLESNTIIGNYLLLANAPDSKGGILEPLQNKPNWVGFWKTPGYPGLYGLKPNYLGNDLLKEQYPGR